MPGFGDSGEGYSQSGIAGKHGIPGTGGMIVAAVGTNGLPEWSQWLLGGIGSTHLVECLHHHVFHHRIASRL